MRAVGVGVNEGVWCLASVTFFHLLIVCAIIIPVKHKAVQCTFLPT